MNKRLDKKKQKQFSQAAAQIIPASATLAPAPEQVNFYIQYQDQEYLSADITAKIKDKCHADSIHTSELSIYLKPEDKKAYYTAGTVSGSIDL